jgi:hypothetical protein
MERNPYSPPSAPLADLYSRTRTKTPWGRAAEFYWAYLWRTVLIVAGMCIVFLMIYPVLRMIINTWPLFERLFRLACVIGMYAFASCLAIKWAAESNFRGYLLRIVNTTNTADVGNPSSLNGVGLARAGRLFAAHLWRYALVTLPINFALIWFFFGPSALTGGDRATILKVQPINLSVGFIAGVWATREALGAAYRGFQFQWVAAESCSDPNVSDTRSSTRDA